MKQIDQETNQLHQTKNLSFEGLYGLLFLILVGLIFLNSGIFAIKEVEVRGIQDISSEDILLTTKLNQYKNIFQVDIPRVKKEMLKDPKIASVAITRVFPHKISIVIKERNPLCLLLYLENLLIVGEDSVVMGIKDENDPIDLPIVTGIELQNMKIGMKILESKFDTVTEILKYADDNLQQIISEINLKDFQLYLDLPASHHTLKVELGNATKLERKIYNLRAILSHTSRDELSKIDLRVSDLPTVIKLK